MSKATLVFYDGEPFGRLFTEETTTNSAARWLMQSRRCSTAHSKSPTT
jgi:hypothetical protein